MKIFNRKARYNYQFEEGSRLEVGVSLTGGEAKSIREKHADISDSVVRILHGEAYLINANIPSLGIKLEPTRMRKLLLHKNELLSLATKMKQRKLTLVPISLYNKGRLIKLEVALGKPKQKFEKRESIKRKDIEREVATQFKSRLH